MHDKSLSKDEKIAKVIRKGHEIAEKMKNMQSTEELAKFEPQIDEYADFVDENFGKIDEWNEEKECELTTFLYVMIDWAKRALQPENKGFQPARRQFLIYKQEFENFLDSKNWVL